MAIAELGKGNAALERGESAKTVMFYAQWCCCGRPRPACCSMRRSSRTVTCKEGCGRAAGAAHAQQSHPRPVPQVGDGVFEVLSTSGDTHLGGDDFDKRIVDFLAEDFRKSEGIDLRKDRQALQVRGEAGDGRGRGRGVLGTH